MTIQSDAAKIAAEVNAEILNLNAEWATLHAKTTALAQKIGGLPTAVVLRLRDFETGETVLVSKHPVAAAAIVVIAVGAAFAIGRMSAFWGM